MIRTIVTFAALLPGIARANDWYVDASFSNCAQSNGSAALPYCTISAAVAHAASGDTIHIAPGSYFETVTVGIALDFVGTQGAAVTILDGAGSNPTMVVNPSADVSISGITFHAAALPQPYTDGAALTADHASVTLADCVVDSCSAGIMVTYGDLTVDRCTFTGNVGSYCSSSIDAHYGTNTVRDSSFVGNAGGLSAVELGAPATVERCVFQSNQASSNFGTPAYGAALLASDLTATDCLFDSNFISATSFEPGGYGGAAVIEGTSVLTRCRFVGNSNTGPNGSGAVGGALYISSGTVTLTDCEIVQNLCTTNWPGHGAIGGGVAVEGFTVASVSFLRCTIAGNRADGPGTLTSGGTGGGVWISNYNTGVVTFEDTVVADNFAANPSGAPDVDGTATTNDYNLFGNTAGLTLTGTGPNDLLDVDPLFVDPANGDFSLQAASPCVDSADPLVAPGGFDVGGVPRVLDGKLTRVLVLDRGAREFDNVQVAVSGQATPGGTITIDSTGTAGLAALLIVGAAERERIVLPFGSLFVDLTAPFVILPWGVLPNSQTITISPGFPVPTTLTLQEAALSARVGNFSNFVSLEIE